jgi:hypothetical protein
VEFGVLLQLERHRHVGDVHVLGEFALELVAVVIGHAARTALHLVADQPVVAIPGHFIAGHVGADAVNVEIVRPALGDDEKSLGTRVGFRRGPDRRSGGRQRSRGQAGNRFQKIAALHDRLQRNVETVVGTMFARFVPSLIPTLTTG